jgi:DNA uptake protein ComE-like DNA-binding protein
MFTRRVLVTSVALALLSVPAFAQGNQPAMQPSTQPMQPAKPAPAVTAPAKPTTTGVATAPVVAKTNLNTATAADLDKLPKIGPARAKAIVEARAKDKFKNWDDFVARKVVPSDAAAAIKDVVTF